MELYELNYSDLLLLSSEKIAESPEEAQRLESVARMVMETLGPNGPGLLAITGVSRASSFRRKLLPLARKLALLSNEDRKKLLKEHNLGSDVPLKNLERIVSSFAKKLEYDKRFKSNYNYSCESGQLRAVKGDGQLEVDQIGFKNLGNIFNELGFCMMEVGLRIAQVCDKLIGGNELQMSLLESGTAKGRLIHYHSTIDNELIKNAVGTNISVKKGAKPMACDEWQQWHYDYGIFTILTAPMFIFSSSNHKGLFPITKEIKNPCIPCDQESSSPSGHTYLEIFHPSKDQTFMVKAPPESLIVQVGEAADILSKGKLQATLHRVCRPKEPKNLSRETFVVFLQPPWSKQFSLSDYPLNKQLHSNDHSCRFCTEEMLSREKIESETLNICSIVPPLSSRLRDGMTFADFSRATTNQYYGSNGLQSSR
ncbi:unnamed protein product [Cuscuta europaea]|uniref:feruloyl-CoA 6-hydroxylase n=2 Tax=Cuscuta europaea TaxID=41803 RepID=A0A9P1E590_CUSEU|nr:unnamed protein product [Cuscuta europaea]